MDTTLSDLRQNYCDLLKQSVASIPKLKGVHKINLTHPDFESTYSMFLKQFDTIVALNVVEHIEDPEKAIQNCHQLLTDGGHLIILVPAYQCLYNQFDKALEHYRRYTLHSLKTIIENNHFNIVHAQYWNAVSIAGWFVSANILQNKSIPEGQMGVLQSLSACIRFFDKLIQNQFGLRAIVVREKQE